MSPIYSQSALRTIARMPIDSPTAAVASAAIRPGLQRQQHPRQQHEREDQGLLDEPEHPVLLAPACPASGTMSLSTSSRTLQLLSLLQTHRYWPGADLAERLGVSVRTLRRDTERLEFTYTAASGEPTARQVEPHRLVALGRRWYLVAYDLTRHDWRSFRLDRLQEPRSMKTWFRPRQLPADDTATFVRAGYRERPGASRRRGGASDVRRCPGIRSRSARTRRAPRHRSRRTRRRSRTGQRSPRRRARQ